ncbi:MAG: hypothetical protein ACTSYA_00875 [Candidatus Kariarchaeaceae archaeon]
MSNESEKNNQSKDSEKENNKEIRDELDYLKDTLKNLQKEYEAEVDVEYLEDDVLEDEGETPKKTDQSKPFGVDLSDPKNIIDMISKMGPMTEKISKMFKPTEDGEKTSEGGNPMGIINSIIKNLATEQPKKEEVHEVIKINKEEMDDFSDTVAFILKSAGTKDRVKILNVLAEREHFTGELGSQVNLRGEELRKNLEVLDRTGLINYSNEENKPHEITAYGRTLINSMTKLFMNDFS